MGGHGKSRRASGEPALGREQTQTLRAGMHASQCKPPKTTLKGLEKAESSHPSTHPLDSTRPRQMSFFDTVADAHVDTMPVPSAPALDDAPAPDAAPVDNKNRRVCPTLEEEDDEGKVEEDKKEKDLFVGEFEEEVVAVTEACAKRPRAPDAGAGGGRRKSRGG